MGQHTSDYYLVENLEILYKKDNLPFHYIWLDPKMNGVQNQTYLTKFKNIFSVDGQDSIPNFKNTLQNFNFQKQALRIICSAALADEVYEFIQKHQNIDRMILFCSSKIRANNLLRDYPKIKKACFNSGEIIKTIKIWQSQNQQSIIFVESDQFGQLNKHTANWRALVDEKNIHPQRARKDLQKYCIKFFKSPDMVTKFNQQLSKVSQNEGTLIKFIQDWMDSQSTVILKEINFLFKCTNNPFKLAYIRYFTSLLYKAIKSHYNQTSYKQRTYFGSISLTEEQKRKLTKGNVMTFNHFFSAKTKLAIDDELIVQIAVQQRHKEFQCEGYIVSDQRIIFNLGNFFRIEQYIPLEKILKISLIQLSLSNDKKQTLTRQIHLNQTWMMNQQKRFQGQWFAIVVNKQQAADSYINKKIEQVQKQSKKDKTITSSSYKWKFNCQILKISKDIPTHVIQKSLETLIVDSKTVYENLLGLSALAHLYLIRQQTTKLKSIIEKINIQQQKQMSSSINDNDLSLKIRIIKIAYNWLFDKQNIGLESVEKQLQARSIQYEADQLYHFLLEIKIICLEQREKYTEELNSINILMNLYSICKGKNCPQFAKLSKNKRKIKGKIDLKLAQEDMAWKKKLNTSAVPLQYLLHNYNQNLDINAGSIEFELFS